MVSGHGAGVLVGNLGALLGLQSNRSLCEDQSDVGVSGRTWATGERKTEPAGPNACKSRKGGFTGSSTDWVDGWGRHGGQPRHENCTTYSASSCSTAAWTLPETGSSLPDGVSPCHPGTAPIKMRFSLLLQFLAPPSRTMQNEAEPSSEGQSYP